MKQASKILASLIAFALSPTVLDADDADDLRCISEKVVISDIEIMGFRNNWLGYTYRISNNLPFTMGGATISVVVLVSERPLPLETSSSSELRDISGGLMAGETMDVVDAIHLSERSLLFAQNSNDLTIVIKVDNVADDTMTQFLAGSWINGWETGPSTYICE